jgi:hypothetical protein
VNAKKRTAYIAGPMTNIPHFNFPAFDSVARAARAEGFVVSNPHEHDQELYPTIDEAEATKVGDVQALATEIGFSFAGAMTWDLSEVIRVSHLILLPDWEKSTGARFERAVAEACGKTILLACEPEGYPADEPDPWVFVNDYVQDRITQFLRGFDPLADALGHKLSNAPPRALLAEMRRRYPQRQFTEPLDKIEAQLA